MGYDLRSWSTCAHFLSHTCLFLWCGGRRKDIRRLAVNWDIGDIKLPHGGFRTVCWPQSWKTRFCKESAIGSNSDIGEILLSKVATLCHEYLRYHRPVLTQSLGIKARYDVTFTAANGRWCGKLLYSFPWVLGWKPS